MRSIGIDIGRYSIKVVEVSAVNRSYHITKAKEYKILNPQTNDQEIDIVQTLAEISKEFDTETAKTVCSVRQQYVSTRKLFFPFKERIKIQKALGFELEDDIPLSVDKAIYDAKILKYHEKTAEVIAMACVAEEVEKTIDIFKHGRIDPDIVAPEFAGIANLYEKWYKSPDDIKDEAPAQKEPDKLIVHMGHSKTFVGVVSNNHVIWGRSIMWGAEKVAQKISQSFSVPFLKALEMMPEKAFVLLTPGSANSDQVKMSAAVSEAFEPLLQSIRLSIMLANTEYTANIENIELMGGASSIKNLPALFTQELSKPTNAVNPIQNLSAEHMQNYEKLNPTFLLALGLAIEGLKRPFNPAINFRQMELAKKNLSFERFWEKWGYTAKIASAAWAVYLVYGIAMSSLSTQLSEVAYDTLSLQAKKIAKVKGGAVQSKVRSYIRRNNKTAKSVKLYNELDEINSPIKWVNDVSQILPSNKAKKSYDIRGFIVKNSEIKIQGVAKSGQTISDIRKALKTIALKNEVKDIPATIPQEPDKQSFAFRFKIKRKN